MDLVVTGLGMVSPVGRDVVSACAAVRAGLRRPSAIHEVQVLDEETDDAVSVMGYPMRGFTDGFAYAGRWSRLAQAGFADLVHYGRLPDASATGFWARTGVALVTPVVDPDRFSDPESFGLDRLAESYGYPLLRALGVPIPAQNLMLVSSGHAGTAVAMQAAAQAVAADRLERVVVLAADSYVDEPTLQWLQRHGRLKGDDNPAGLIPGEAAAAILLESRRAAIQRAAVIQAVVVRAAAATERNHLFTDEVNTGRALASVAAHVLDGEPVFAGDVLVDLNGESWRAYELGCAQVRLAGRWAETARTVLICDSMGEIGAASGAAGICMVVRSFVRRYRRDARALVLSSAEHGYVGAILLLEP